MESSLPRILVTGGSGFIGTNLVDALLKDGAEVLNVDIAPPRNVSHHRVWSQVEILERDVLAATFQSFQPDIIYHLAARTDLDGDSVDAYKANTVGVRNVLQSAADLPNLKRIVLASSMLVCELGYIPAHEQDYKPSTFYGESKAIGEKIVRLEAHSSTSWTIIRPTSIWGPWFSTPYRDFFDLVRRGRYLHPRGAGIERSYGFVSNAVAQIQALANAAESSVRGRVFYIADYEPIRIKEWAGMISRELGNGPIRELPASMFWLAARMGDLLRSAGFRNVPIYSFRLENMLTSSVFDLSEVERLCGPLPYDLEQGVRETVGWLLRQQP
jgi:GlcNAc-P-P-Und epimerase